MTLHKYIPYIPGKPLPKGFIELYIESFPPEERRSWQSNADAERFIASHPDMSVLLAFDDKGDFAGFWNYWYLNDTDIYGEHLAVSPRLRNQGLGAALISELKRISHNRIMIEVELPEDEITRRRIAMYERHGFVQHPEIEYNQPSYTTGESSIPLLIMASPELDPAPLIPRLKSLVYGVPTP